MQAGVEGQAPGPGGVCPRHHTRQRVPSRRLMARAAVVGKAPQLASVKAIATTHGIVLEWGSSAASGRIGLGLKEARTLGAQLVALADRYASQVNDEDE